MEQTLLKYLLFASSVVMYAYGLFSFFTFTPKGEEYRSYQTARRLFGAYMIFMACCLLAHLYFDLRGQNPLLATSLCVIYIVMGTMFMSVILSSLMQADYPFRVRLKQVGICALALGGLLAVNYIFVPKEKQNIILIACGVFYMAIAIITSVQFYRMYRKTIKRADNYYSDNIAKLLNWIPVALYVTIVLVVAGAFLPFLSRISFIILYLFLGLLVYTFIFISLQNYMMNIAKMKILLLTNKTNDKELNNSAVTEQPVIEVTSRESKAVKLKLDKWLEDRGYTKQGLTLDDLALELDTNRTYLSSYINTVYNQSFRNWIAQHRFEYAKELLQDKKLSSVTIANIVGYSPNAFIKIFTKTEGVSPSQWRNENV